MSKVLFSWFNDRTGFGDWCRRLAEAIVPGRASWSTVWPCTIIFAFCVQVITGFFLWTYYSPSAQTAWESVYFLQCKVAGGWLLRAMHHYAAHVLLALLLLYIVQSILTRACRAPRELVFWTAVGLGLCALAAVLTGDLLAWDQNGYAATKTRTGFLTFLPWVGDGLLKIAIGGPGPALGHLTLTRFFALHVGVFATAFFLLLIAHGVLARRVSDSAGKFTAFSPRPLQWAGVLCNATACLVVLAVILLLACRQGVTPPWAGVPLLSPADTDPAGAYGAARPEWFLVGIYEFSHWFPGGLGIIPIFIVPGLLICIVLAMPFLANHPIGHGFNVVFTVAVLAALVGLSWYSLAKDRDDEAYQKAVAAEKRQVQRVCELARHEGIPPTGALALLRNDPKTQGPRLFSQQCASCHDHAAGAGGDPMEQIRAEKSSAPNLAGFAGRQWLSGLLDPKRIVGSGYFGDTKFRGGRMAGFVREVLGDLDPGEKKDLEKVVAAVSAEAKLPGQRQLDAQDAKTIEQGRKLLVEDFGCTDCHKFHDKGRLGDAPELTGYGSPRWIEGIVRNPAERRFYGDRNDRMPADTVQDALKIELLTRWLRGDWYEEGLGIRD